MTPKENFDAKVRELIRQARALSPAARRQVLELLNEARKRIVGELAAMDPASFQAAQLRTLKSSIDAAFDRFARDAAERVGRSQQVAFQMGAAMVEEPLRAAGLTAPSFLGVSSSTLAIAQGYTADLIGGLSRDAAAKVNATIQRAFLGGQSITDIIEQIGRALSGGRGFTGLFSAVGERATTIALNEIGRVHSISEQTRLEDMKERHPELKKEWHWVPVARMPRPEHQAASGQVREVEEPFEVAGEELMYPRDPAGSPENTINCHCLMQPHFDPEALKPGPGSEEFLRSLGIEIRQTPG